MALSLDYCSSDKRTTEALLLPRFSKAVFFAAGRARLEHRPAESSSPSHRRRLSSCRWTFFLHPAPIEYSGGVRGFLAICLSSLVPSSCRAVQQSARFRPRPSAHVKHRARGLTLPCGLRGCRHGGEPNCSTLSPYVRPRAPTTIELSSRALKYFLNKVAGDFTSSSSSLAPLHLSLSLSLCLPSPSLLYSSCIPRHALTSGQSQYHTPIAPTSHPT